MRELAQRPVRSLADRTPGPGLFHGQLAGRPHTPETSTDHQPVVLSLVEYRKQVYEELEWFEFSPSVRTACLLARGDGLELVADGQRVELDTASQADRLWLRGQLEGVPWSPLPYHAPPSCQLPTNVNIYYREVSFPIGTEVWVSGCRNGDVITRCDDDRADIIAAGSRKMLTRYLLQGKTAVGSITMLLGLLGFLLAFLSAASAIAAPTRRT